MNIDPANEIARILSGKSCPDGSAETIDEDDVRAAESIIGFTFPPSYRAFLALGGLSELRINHRVLRPGEIVDSLRYVQADQYVPFADNGCGDLYCWQRVAAIEPSVVFADHETKTYSDDSNSFLDWLASNKF